MKNILMIAFGNSFRSTATKAFTTLFMATLPALHPSTAKTPVIEPPTMEAKVFEISKPLTFRMIAKNHLNEKVVIYIRSERGEILYRETFKKPAVYNRDYNLQNLADGNYCIEITNGKDKYRCNVSLKTAKGRTLKIK